MPRDDTHAQTLLAAKIPPLLDELTAMGIAPVPQWFVNRYKRAYRRKHRGGHLAKWMTVEVFNSSLRNELQGAALIRASSSTWVHGSHGSAPAALIDLAENVQRNVTEPQFDIEYFYADPILSVTYGPSYNRRRAPLGVYDSGVSVRMATTIDPTTAVRGWRGVWQAIFG